MATTPLPHAAPAAPSIKPRSEAPSRPAPLRRQGPRRAEKLLVGALLALAFCAQLALTRHLAALGAFDQYNLFFDADANQYLAVIAHGWGVIRGPHPGFALLVNLPLRALDYVALQAGLAPAGAIGSAAALLLPALCGALGAWFWWRACVWAGLGAGLRLAGLLLLQTSFSQIVFSALPESYPLSGMLYCILLWAAARAHSQPAMLERIPVQAGWLGLGMAMTAVTVTNGFMCVAAWWALRAGRPRRAALEAAAATLIVAFSIYAERVVDSAVYSLARPTLGATVAGIANMGLKSTYVPDSVAQRIVALPALAMASVAAPPVALIRNELAERNASRYRFGFSVNASAASAPRLALAWLLTLAALAAAAAARPALAASALARAVGAVLLLNAALHAVWGTEVFLYSQHWLAFLVFALSCALRGLRKRGAGLLLGLALAIAANNIWRCGAMLDVLHASGQI